MPERSAHDRAMIRVLITGHLPPPIGGMATYYQTLLNSSLSKHVDYRFVQTSSQKRRLANSGRFTASNLIAAVRDCVRFTHALASFHPQIVHIGTAFGLSFLKNSYCVLISRLLRKQVLLHPHCSLSFLYFDRSKTWQWFFRQVIRRTNGIVVLSQEWFQLESIVPGCKVFYLPNAVNLAEYREVFENRKAGSHRRDPLSILYLGYLGKAKGSFDLLEAAKQTEERGVKMIFNLVGSELTPGELNLLHEKIQTLHLKAFVKLHEPVYDADKMALFRNADIFVYPSYHEGIPMAVLEAMGSGLPVVASRTGGLPDLVHDGVNGILIEPGHPVQLADALCSLAKNPSRRLAMQKESHQIVRDRFSMDRHVSQLINIYEQVLCTSLPKKKDG